MHRSGTSAFCSILDSLAISCGKTIMRPSYDNPKGFFENHRIVRLNNEILETLRTNWDNPVSPFMRKYNSQLLANHALLARKIIKEEFSNETTFFMKDPRLCYTLPFWHKIFQEENIDVFHYIILRNPLEIAESLHNRNNFALNKCYILFASYILSAEYFTRGSQRYIFDYNEILRSSQEIKKLISNQHKYVNKSNELLIDKNLRHFKITETFRFPNSLNYVLDLYRHLKSSKLDYQTIDNIRITHSKNLEDYIIPWFNNQHFVKMLYSTTVNANFQEIKNISVVGDNLKYSHNFDISNLNKIKFIPLNSPHILRINELIINNHDIQIKELRTNAFKLNRSFIFGKVHSFIEMDVPNTQKGNFTRLEIDFSYIIGAKKIIEYIKKLKLTYQLK